MTPPDDPSVGTGPSTLSRRSVLALSGAAVTSAVVPIALPTGWPGSGPAVAAPADVATIIAKLTGGKPIAEGRIKLDLPPVAENGLSVPLTFDVESPMTAADHVKAVHILAEENPLPHIATYRFTPMSPKASVSIRIRLAKTQKVVALAEMVDGSFHAVKRDVTVTVGGCTG
ncbi:MAG: thiosulfate oxidation carrier protein SoxY [Hyphomicrobiaceae bacterium]|nr:thiosulfate oxidation carrier protein SoxY [Hyphomicrobiaceae bacterium]